MAQRKTREEFINEALIKHEGKYDYHKVEYINSNTKVCIICPKHGEFMQTPESHIGIKRCGCQKCKADKTRTVKRNTTSFFIEKGNKIHGYYYDYSLSNYITNRTPLIIICPKHGEFYQKPIDHLAGCGCKDCGREKTINSSISHGRSNHYLYNTWTGIIARCYDENNKSYYRYGGRGIKMSDEFRHDFSAFLEYIESLPNYEKKITEKFSLDRIENNGDYERGNLRWANHKTQRDNQRVRGKLGYDGVDINKHGEYHFTLVMKKTGFKTLEEALTARNEYIKNHNLPHKIQ